MNIEIKNQSINIEFKGASFLIQSAGSIPDGDKGDITVSSGGTVWTIDNQAVTRQKLEHIKTGHFLGRHASGTGDVQEVSPAQALAILGLDNVLVDDEVIQTNVGAGSAVQSGFFGMDGEFGIARLVNNKGDVVTQYVNNGTASHEFWIDGAKRLEINQSGLVSSEIKYFNLSSAAITAPIDTNLNTLYTYTIPAGTLGANSVLSLEMLWSATNNANTKTIKCTIGTSDIFSINFNNNASLNRSLKLYNRNATNSQVAFIAGNSLGFGSATTAAATYTIDFSVSQTVNFTIQKATAGDMVRLEAVLTQIINP